MSLKRALADVVRIAQSVAVRMPCHKSFLIGTAHDPSHPRFQGNWELEGSSRNSIVLEASDQFCFFRPGRRGVDAFSPNATWGIALVGGRDFGGHRPASSGEGSVQAIESELTKTTSFAKTAPGVEVNFFPWRLRWRSKVQEQNEWSVEVRNRRARRIGALEPVEFAYRGFISDRCDLARQGEAGFLEEHPDRIVAAP